MKKSINFRGLEQIRKRKKPRVKAKRKEKIQVELKMHEIAVTSSRDRYFVL